MVIGHCDWAYCCHPAWHFQTDRERQKQRERESLDWKHCLSHQLYGLAASAPARANSCFEHKSRTTHTELNKDYVHVVLNYAPSPVLRLLFGDISSMQMASQVDSASGCIYRVVVFLYRVVGILLQSGFLPPELCTGYCSPWPEYREDGEGGRDGGLLEGGEKCLWSLHKCEELTNPCGVGKRQ